MDKPDINLLDEWKKLTEEKFSKDKIQKQDIMNAIQKESSSTIVLLKTRLKAKIYWVVLFVVLFASWMLFSLNRPELLMIVGSFNFLYILGFFFLYKQYKQMDDYLDLSDNTLNIMKKNANLIKKALRYEKLSGMFLLPCSFIVGILVSRHYNGYTILETFQDNRLMIIILILIIVGTPFVAILSEKMNKHAYGALIEKLDNNIIRMEMIK